MEKIYSYHQVPCSTKNFNPYFVPNPKNVKLSGATHITVAVNINDAEDIYVVSAYCGNNN